MTGYRLTGDELATVAELLGASTTLRKVAHEGKPLVTWVDAADGLSRCAHLVDKLANEPASLSEGDLQEVVWAIDFMAACFPDNNARTFSLAHRDLAARLRKLYFSLYGSSAYGG